MGSLAIGMVVVCLFYVILLLLIEYRTIIVRSVISSISTLRSKKSIHLKLMVSKRTESTSRKLNKAA